LFFIGGVEVWSDFQEKIGLHVGGSYTNHVGLYGLLGDGLLLNLARAGVVVLFLACVRRATLTQSAILGCALIYAFGFIACYYYCFLLLLLLWKPFDRSDIEHAYLCVGVLSVQALPLFIRVLNQRKLEVRDADLASSMEISDLIGLYVPLYDSNIYLAASAVILGLFAALYALALRNPVVGSAEAEGGESMAGPTSPV
jgi:hypothetical protein